MDVNVGEEFLRDLRHLQSATTGAAPPDRLVAPREMLNGIFDIAALSDDVDAVDFDVQVWASGRYALSRSAGSNVVLQRSQRTIHRGPFDGFAVRWLASGGHSGRAGLLPIEARAGDILLIDMARESAFQSSGTEDVTLWFPRARLQAALGDEPSIHGLVVSGASPVGAMIAACLRALGEQVSRMGIVEMDALAGGVTDLLARALAASLITSHLGTAPAPLASFLTIRRFIDRSLASPKLSPEMVATTFGLSRDSLYRLFAPVGGVASYIRMRRLQRAYEEITAPGLTNRRIGPIAYSLGFKNFSAFSRAFHGAFGLSPAEARKASLTRNARLHHDTSIGSDGTFVALLMRLIV